MAQNASEHQRSARTSENSVKKLSEKSLRCPTRGFKGYQSGAVRPVLAPEYRPNTRSELYSDPFSDSFKAKFALPHRPVPESLTYEGP